MSRPAGSVNGGISIHRVDQRTRRRSGAAPPRRVAALVLEGCIGGSEARALQARNRVYVDVARKQSGRAGARARVRISVGLLAALGELDVVAQPCLLSVSTSVRVCACAVLVGVSVPVPRRYPLL